MAEQVEEYNFSNKELVEALIKQQGLHEGIWMLGVRFGLGGINVNHPDNSMEATPAAVVPIIGFNLRKQAALNPLALDAAIVNPAHNQIKKKK
jgi:hypothetical protein